MSVRKSKRSVHWANALLIIVGYTKNMRFRPPTSWPNIAAIVGLSLLIVGNIGVPGGAVEESKDFLDSFMGWYAVRGQQSGFFFDFSHIAVEIFQGVPLNAFALGDLNIGVAFYNFLDPIDAYAANFILIHVLAYAGMFLLLRDHVFFDRKQSSIVVLGAFCFAVLPHQVWLMGTGAALPLSMWGFINVWRGKINAVSVASVLGYPFYSFAVYGALQMYFAAGIATFVGLFLNRRNFRALFLLTGALIALFLLVESRLFYHWFFASGEYVSNRSLVSDFGSARTFLHDFSLHFIFGSESPHQTFHYPLVLPLVGMVATGVAITKLRGRQELPSRRFGNYLLLLLFLSVSTSIFVAVEREVYLADLLFGLPFSLARADAAQPMLWWIMFSLAIAILSTSNGIIRRVAAPVIATMILAHSTLQFPAVKFEIKEALQIPQTRGLRASIAALVAPSVDLIDFERRPILSEALGLVPSHYDTDNPLGADGRLSAFRRSGSYRLQDYYEVGAMQALKPALADYLGTTDTRSYRVLTVNLSSAVALVNGFQTPNAYMADYPVDAGQHFIEVFRGEYLKDGLEVPPPASNYLEAYVSRKSLSSDQTSVKLNIDVERLRNLGVRAIFSFLDISNAESLGLISLRRFGNIHLYGFTSETDPMLHRL